MKKTFPILWSWAGAGLLMFGSAVSVRASGGQVETNKVRFDCGMAVATCYSGSNPNNFVMGIIDTRNYPAAPLATNWYAPMNHGPAALQWTRANIGAEVFGLALDDATPHNIFAAATSVYGTAGNGRVARVNMTTGTISTFINFANV